MISFLQRDVAGELEHAVSRAVDAASSPTVTLYSPSGAELQAEASATKGPSTTLDGAAAAGQRTLPVTATTSMAVCEVLWPENQLGQTEPVVVDAISSGVSVEARQDLQNDYASGDTIASRKLSVSVLAASLSAVAKNCRARWVFESGGLEYVEESLFHISLYAPRCTVTEADVLRRHPRARDWTSPDQPLGELIEAVWANEVLTDVSVIWSPTSLISGDSLHVATIIRVVAQLALANDKLDAYDRWFAEYRGALEQAVSEAPIDSDADRASDDELVHHPRVTRLVRG